MGFDSVIEQLKKEADLQLFLNEPLCGHTGFQTGGNAAAMAVPKTKESFKEAVKLIRKEAVPMFILGKGKNVLAADEGYEGIVIKTERALTNVFFKGDTVYCEAGVTLSSLCGMCAEEGLSGLEFAYGIPGTVGGAVFMNAGAYDGEIKDVVTAVDVIDADGNEKRISGEALAFSYRTSFAQKTGDIILGAEFLLAPKSSDEIKSRMNELMARRRDKQPLEYPSCGSTFKRPAGSYASKLIDECGLKGKSVGGAAVSGKHCGFIINENKATTKDILELIDLVKKEVKEKTGYSLECEIRFL